MIVAELKRLAGIALVSVSVATLLVVVAPIRARGIYVVNEMAPSTVFARYGIDPPVQTYTYGVMTRREIALMEIRFNWLRRVDLAPSQMDLRPLEADPEELAQNFMEVKHLVEMSEAEGIPYRIQKGSFVINDTKTDFVSLDFYDLLETIANQQDLSRCVCVFVFAVGTDDRISAFFEGVPDFLPCRDMLVEIKISVDGRESTADAENATAGMLRIWEARTGTNVLVTISSKSDPNEHTEETRRLAGEGMLYVVRTYADDRLETLSAKFLEAGAQDE